MVSILDAPKLPYSSTSQKIHVVINLKYLDPKTTFRTCLSPGPQPRKKEDC